MKRFLLAVGEFHTPPGIDPEKSFDTFSQAQVEGLIAIKHHYVDRAVIFDIQLGRKVWQAYANWDYVIGADHESFSVTSQVTP